MNINDVLKEYRTVEEKNIVITDPNGNLLYKSEKMDIRTDIVLNKIRSLTGLYNKGKYMALKNADFGKPESIAIFNFDVNNLKHINDNYGHEYGDALIIKAAKSIDAVTSENVYGFRMGGDEYVMVAVNVSPEEVRQIQTDWKAALDRLNEEDKEMFCLMACGVSYGSGDYDYDELYEHADKFMYENKKALKADNITSHIVS
ncbi:MAG: GGDEF domain-containing protein [Ruminiclostridium sp.]|nr:GGDEF domain-containing protein [Ruminiclostridium sp.]